MTASGISDPLVWADGNSNLTAPSGLHDKLARGAYATSGADRPTYDRPLSERPRLTKLGVKPGQKTSVLGVEEAGFADELRGAGADVNTRLRKGTEIIFFGADSPADLERISSLRAYLKPNGAIWVVRRKGPKA